MINARTMPGRRVKRRQRFTHQIGIGGGGAVALIQSRLDKGLGVIDPCLDRLTVPPQIGFFPWTWGQQGAVINVQIAVAQEVLSGLG